MAHTVIVGAGTGGMPATYELRDAFDRSHRITVINAIPDFQLVPSNPWVAVGWRDRAQVSFPIAPHLKKKGIEFVAQRALRSGACCGTHSATSGAQWQAFVTATGRAPEFVDGHQPVHHLPGLCYQAAGHRAQRRARAAAWLAAARHRVQRAAGRHRRLCATA